MQFALNYFEMLIIRDGVYSSYQTYKSEVFALAHFPAHLQKLNLIIAARIFYSLKW